MLRLAVWGGTFVVVVAGYVLNLCFQSVPDPSKYWPEKWVSVQSLKPEVRGWVEAECSNSLRRARWAHNVRPLNELVCLNMLLFVNENALLDLAASHSRLSLFERPEFIELDNVLLSYEDLRMRRYTLNRVFGNGNITPIRYRELRREFVSREWSDGDRKKALLSAGFVRQVE